MTRPGSEFPSPFNDTEPNLAILRDATALNSQSPRKRKQENNAEGVLQLSSFTIRPCPVSTYDKPYTLTPLRVLDRSQLPLSFLDNEPTTTSLPTTRLFTANINLFENGNEDSRGANVLIASLDTDNTLYAIEHVKSRIYGLCKLCNWVKIGYLEDETAVGHTPTTRSARAEFASNDGQWWTRAATSDSFEQPAKRPRLFMALQTVPESMNEQSIEYTQPLPYLDNSLLEPEPVSSQLDPQLSRQEIFDTLVRQYLDALYKSRTSLAFFAKGPLSRVRATCNSCTQEDLNITSLVTFLRSMVLPMTAMDKKYREKIPGLVKALPPGMLSDSEQEGPASTKKKKSKKPPKMSKEGFYSFEDQPCKRWWLAQGSGSRPRQDETAEQLLRRRIGDLRVRETLAQIILVLEIIALEASSGFQILDTEAQGGLSKEKRETQEETEFTKPKTKRKAKKPLNLNLQLDLLLDKLTIWQSIEQDESIDAASKHQDPSSRDNAGKLQDRDILATFCIEVIIPFFKSRVPEKASLVNKKFGGPGAVSPEKLRKPKAAQSIEKKPRRPLQKTPSDSTGNLKSRPATLARSATDSLMPRLKREASDISIFEIPQARPGQRDSSVQLKHLKQRQVDLSAITAATDAKLKQKAKIEEELKDAISTLKKPNRGLAIKEYVDASEQRSLGSASMRKKTTGPNRKIFQNVQNVLVTATPRHARKRDALQQSRPSHSREDFGPEPELQPPSSGNLVIPSSAIRPPQGLTSRDQSPSYRNQTTSGHGVTETPSRAASKTVSFAESSQPMPKYYFQKTVRNDVVQSTPVTASTKPKNLETFLQKNVSRDAIFLPPTPSKSKRPERIAPTTLTTPQKPRQVFATPQKKPAPLFATPQKSVRQPATVAQTPELKRATTAPESVNAEGGQSIYDALGWNDDFDELA